MTDLDRYIAAHTSSEDELLKELDRATNLRVVQPRMISGHVQGCLLEMLVRMMKPHRVLEIGTFTGYSALCLAAGLEEGAFVDTIEIDDELESITREFMGRSPYGDKIRLHIGSAMEIVPSLGETFDLVYMDGDKREYPAYLQMLMGDVPSGTSEGRKPLVHSGSFILADNILWAGKVVEPLATGDNHTRAILRFNDMVVSDPRLEVVIIPIRDGLSIIRVR